MEKVFDSLITTRRRPAQSKAVDKGNKPMHVWEQDRNKNTGQRTQTTTNERYVLVWNEVYCLDYLTQNKRADGYDDAICKEQVGYVLSNIFHIALLNKQGRGV